MRKEIRHEIEARLYKYAKGQERSKAWQMIMMSELEKLTEQQKRLFALRYKDKKTEKEICRILHIERSTYYAWINDILQGIALTAAYEKIIKP